VGILQGGRLHKAQSRRILLVMPVPQSTEQEDTARDACATKHYKDLKITLTVKGVTIRCNWESANGYIQLAHAVLT
jgi:hypothetical protein